MHLHDTSAPAAAVPTPEPEAAQRALLTDEQRLAPVLRTLSREDLYALAGWAEDEANSRTGPLLLDVLRTFAAQHAGDGTPVATVEFCANPNWENGIFWEDDWMTARRADGSLLELEVPDRGENSDAERLRDLLADYSCADRPQRGQTLTVDLAGGTFTVTA